MNVNKQCGIVSRAGQEQVVKSAREAGNWHLREENVQLADALRAKMMAYLLSSLQP